MRYTLFAAIVNIQTAPNPKANTFANPGRYQRQAARTHDVKEKRLHVPLVDRFPEESPPLIVAVVGPPQVGDGRCCGTRKY